MQSDDPPFLTVGTEVSAKFKGAFCEAKVKRMSKSVKCKIQLKTPPYGTIFADHTEIKGTLEVNQQVEITQGKATYKGVIQNIKDNSIYVVVFNDGDERQLRRTQVCIKGAKHFNEDVSLDAMPLYKPEAFSNPVIVTDEQRKKHKRRKLERPKRRQQLTAKSAYEKELNDDNNDGNDDDDDDGDMSSEDVTTLDESSSCCTIFTETSNTISESAETMTVPKQTGRILRTRPLTSKLTAASRRLRSARGTFTTYYKQNSTDRDMKIDYNDNDIDENGTGNGTGGSGMRSFTRLQKASVSRMIADKILTKSIARTRKKRFAAKDALKRLKESSNGDEKRRACGVGVSDENDGNDDDDNNDYKDGGVVDDDDDYDYKDDDDGDVDKGKGKTRARKKHCSSDDNDDDKFQSDDKKMDLSTSSGSTNRKSERKRQGFRDKGSEPVKKRQKDVDDVRKLYEIGNIVAVFEDSTRKGKWIPAVVVSETVFKTFTRGSISFGKNDLLLRSFKDAKYFACSVNKLSSPGASVLKMPESVSKAALDRAVAFVEKDVLPMGWEKTQIFDDDTRPKKSERRSPSAEPKKRPETSGKAKQEKEKTKASAESSSESESSTDEEYGEERDQFTAQLYKFHEERGTPINRAPILGGKDIDMFRLYNVVQRFGGKKRVTENNQWKLVLRKMHLEGCPGATSVTVKNAYSRYLDHFNSFYRSLGISSWLSTSTPSTSSRSERPNRLLDRQNIQKKWALMEARKKEKEKAQKENAMKVKTATKREKDENALRTKKEKIKKEERIVTKSDASEDDDKMKAAPSTSSQSSTPLPSQSPGGRTRARIKDEEDVEKGSVSDSGTFESSKDRGSVKDEKESPVRGRPRGSRKKEGEKEMNRDEEPPGSKITEIDKRTRAYKTSKADKDKKLAHEGGIKRNSPSTVSSVSNVDQGISGSDDEARIRQARLKEPRKLSTTAAPRPSGDQKESPKNKREGSATGKDTDVIPKKEKTKEGVVPWLKCRPATVLTNFYMGQNVKAYHHGQWYDARVITLGRVTHNDVLSSMMDFEARCKAINESTERTEKERREALTAATARLNDRLESILREMTCCVHYLGWNSRYDEWVELIKIKVHEKDQKSSEEQFLSIASDKLNAPTLEAAVAWRSSLDLSKLFAKEASSSGMRPRRLSHTHEHTTSLESRSRSTTFSEKRVKKIQQKGPPVSLSSTGAANTPSDSTEQSTVQCASADMPSESGTEITLNRLPEEATVSQTPSQLLFANAAVSSTVSAVNTDKKKLSKVDSNLKRRRTLSESCPIAVINAAYKTSKKSQSVRSDSQKTDAKMDETEESYEQPKESQTGNEQETMKPQVDMGSAAKMTGKDGEISSCILVTVPVRTNVVGQNQDENKTQEIAELHILTRSAELLEGKEDSENRRKEVTAGSQISPTEDSSEKMTLSNRDSVSMESETAAEELASKENDEDVWHPPMSLALKQRGRGMKKKKTGRNATTATVERKGPGKGLKRVNNEEQSKGSEESSSSDDESLPNVRDSWHALKVRMQQKIDAEGALENAEKELKLDPIDGNLSGDALISKLQERLQELRDIYHSVRSEQAHLDRRWRKTLEKKHRDKEQKKKELAPAQLPADIASQ